MSVPSLLPRLPRKFLVLSGVVALIVALLPWLGAWPASAAGSVTITPSPTTSGCNGVKTTAGSANTTKTLIGGSLQPGGTAQFQIGYPFNAADVGGTFSITDCLFGEVGTPSEAAFQKFDIDFVPNNATFTFDYTVAIPATLPVGSLVCNYAKTTATPTKSQASNRKAEACFHVGGDLRIEKHDSSTGLLLPGATFSVNCTPTGPTPPIVISGIGAAPVTANSTSGVAGTGSIGITGPEGSSCVVTETAPPAGYDLPATASHTYTIPRATGTPSVQVINNAPTVVAGNLTIAKSVDKATAAVNDPLAYTIDVGATGADQTNVAVSDVVPASLTFDSSFTPTCVDTAAPAVSVCTPTYTAATHTLSASIGSVTAGSTVEIVFHAFVNAIASNADGSVPGETITNRADATSTEVPAGVHNGATTTVAPVGVTGDLTIQKDVDKATAPYGSTLTYTVTAGASGTRNQTNVVVDDVVPAGMTYVPGSAACGGSCTAAYDPLSNTVTWTVGTINAGTNMNSLTYQAVIDTKAANADGSISGSTITNTASGTSNSATTPVTDDAVTNVPGVAAPAVPPATAPNLHLAKASSPASGAIVQRGDRIDYTVTVTNTGNGAATGQTLTDTLPTGVTLVAGSADPAPTSVAGQVLTWTVDVPAQSGATPGSATVSYAVTVDKDAAPGATLTNAATLAGLLASTDHHVASGDLTLVKRVAQSSAEYGDTLDYSFTAAATGTSTQHNVVVSDVLPDGTTYADGSARCTDAGTCTASYDDATRTVTWSLGDIAAGSSRELGFSVTIDTPDYDPAVGLPAKVIHNVASIAADGFTAAPSNEVKTPLVAVLGVKVVRKPPTKHDKPAVEPTSHSRLPFTGSNLPVWPATAIALMLITAGTGLTVTRRRRPGTHS